MLPVRRRVVLLAAVATPVGAFAHGFHAAFTVIELNARTGTLEIFHRISVQDLSIVLAARTGEQRTFDPSPQSQKLVEDYLLDVFHLSSTDGMSLKPDWVGMKIEIDTALIYRELKVTGVIAGLVVDDHILTETNQGQVNSVNVTIGGRTRTAVFMINDPPQSLTF